MTATPLTSPTDTETARAALRREWAPLALVTVGPDVRNSKGNPCRTGAILTFAAHGTITAFDVDDVVDPFLRALLGGPKERRRWFDLPDFQS